MDPFFSFQYTASHVGMTDVNPDSASIHLHG